ncbi:MAG: type II secretion system F family protein, partial [Crenarchaeota archaeon]|nr:type II secretion system F family protein [Thermoproteota archaeon]
LRHGELNRSVEKAATIVEAYSVMLIVVLCVYILFVVFSSSGMSDLVGSSILTSPIMSYLVAFVFFLIMSVFFIVVAHTMQKSTLGNLKFLYKKALLIIAPCIAVIAATLIIPGIADSMGPIGLPEIATICLTIGSLIPAIQYYKISKINYNADDSVPLFIRDVTEAHKIGLSPEKSIVQATKRKSYGGFQKFLEMMRSQIEWGVPIRKTFTNITKEIRSWFAIANLAMLIETIEIGGESTEALEILSQYSEKERELQINRRELLKPYVLLAFIWSALIAVTTIVVSLTTQMMSGASGSSAASSAMLVMDSQMKMFSVGIILQCWISGFFIGQISEGNLGAGFRYSAMLAVTAYVSLILSQILLSQVFGSVSTIEFS